MHLWDQPHHSPAAIYASGTLEVGQQVTCDLTLPPSLTGWHAHVRTVIDGEPRFLPMQQVSAPDAGAPLTLTAQLPLTNPVQPYRFLLTSGRQYRWVNGMGMWDRDVPDAHDYLLTTHAAPPAWQRNAVVYQIFPDRFASSGATHALPAWATPTSWDTPPAADGDGRWRQYYGGDLPGIAAHLDYIEQLGATVIYLTPVFPAGSNHRYDATTFDHVDPLLGGDAALAELTAAAHARGMRVMLDLTTNHTGVGHQWFCDALASPTATEHDFYYWQDDDPGYATWMGEPSLPKLNYGSAGLLDRLAGPGGVVRHWMEPPFGADGWRIDVAHMTGRHGRDDYYHQVAQAVRQAATAANPQALVIAEHCFDLGPDLPGDGWHGAMNYAAFTRPVWSWLASPQYGGTFLGLPAQVARRGGQAMVAAMQDFTAHLAWPAATSAWNLLCSHDTPRILDVTGDPAVVRAAAVLLFAMPATPMVFAGDEWGATGVNGEAARVTMPWDRPEAWDQCTLTTYRSLARVRHSSPALQQGSLRWLFADTEAVGFLREWDGERVLAVVARGPWEGTHLPPWVAGRGRPQSLWGDIGATLSPEGLTLSPTTGPAAALWHLT